MLRADLEISIIAVDKKKKKQMIEKKTKRNKKFLYLNALLTLKSLLVKSTPRTNGKTPVLAIVSIKIVQPMEWREKKTAVLGRSHHRK